MQPWLVPLILRSRPVRERYLEKALSFGNLKMLLPLDDASALTAPDASGGGNSGTASSATQYDVLIVTGGTAADGLYRRNGTQNGYPKYDKDGGGLSLWIYSNFVVWIISPTPGVLNSTGLRWNLNNANLVGTYGPSNGDTTGNPTVSDPLWSTLTVSGPITPSEALGDYDIGGVLGGKQLYKHQTANWWLEYSTGDSLWYLKNGKTTGLFNYGTPLGGWFKSSLTGSFAKFGDASYTGAATVTGKTTSSTQILSGVTWSQPGPTDGLAAAKFTADNGAITRAADLFGTGAYTFCGWFNRAGASTGGISRLIENGKVLISHADSIGTIRVTSDGATTSKDSSEGQLLIGSWVFVAVVRGASGDVSIFANGKSILSPIGAGTPAAGTNTTICNNAALQRRFNGSLALPLVASAAWSADQIAELYRIGGGL